MLKKNIILFLLFILLLGVPCAHALGTNTPNPVLVGSPELQMLLRKDSALRREAMSLYLEADYEKDPARSAWVHSEAKKIDLERIGIVTEINKKILTQLGTGASAAGKGQPLQGGGVHYALP